MKNAKYEEALSKAVKDIYENDFDSLDFYKDIQYIDFDLSKYPIKKKPNHMKYFAIAASLLIFVLLSGAFGILISNGSVSAAKFDAEKQFVKLQNQFSINKDYGGKYIEDDNIVQEIDSLTDIDQGISFFPDLFVPNNIPERFSLESLKITKYTNDLYYAVYIYKDKDDQLLSVSQQIIPKEGMSMSIIGITEEIKTKDGMIYISENPFGDGGNAGSYITDTVSIDVAGMITTEEILSIIKPKE